MAIPPPISPPLPEAREDTAAMQREFICCVWALLGAVGGFALIAWGVLHFYHPDIAGILKQATTLSFFPATDFAPEPTEVLQYMLVALTAPFLLAGGYFLAKRSILGISEQALTAVYGGTLAIAVALFSALVYFCLVAFSEPASNPFQTSPALFSLQYLPFSAYKYWYPFVIFPALLYVFRFLTRVQSPAAQRVGAVGVLVAGVLLAAFTAIFSLFGARAFMYPAYSGDHYSAVFGSMVQVYDGAPLLVDGLRNHYGLYPHFLLPIFKIVGLSVFSFNCVMGVLTSATFLFLFLAMRLLVRCQPLLFFGFFCLVFFCIFYAKGTITSDPYFQYYPIRTIFPAAILFLTTLYLMHERKRLYYPIHVLCALALLWNPETGALVLCAWLTLLIYLELFRADWKEMIRGILRHMMKALLCVVCVFCLYVLTIYLIYGRFPRLDLLFHTLTMYSGLGYYMLPMPLLHPWNLLALTYLTGLLLGVRAVVNREFSPRSAVVLYCAVLGVGFFGYYQARSHSHNIVSVWKECFVLLPIFADMCWGRICEAGWQVKKTPHILLLFLLLFFLLAAGFVGLDVVAVPTWSRCYATLSLESQKAPTPVTDNIVFIRKHTQPGEKILIFSEHEAVYYCETKTRPVMKIGLTDMFFREEWQMMLNVLNAKHPPKIFWSATSSTRAVAQNEWVREAVKRGEFIVRDQTQHMVFIESAKGVDSGEPAP